MGDTRQSSIEMDKGLERDLQEALGLLDDEEIETEEPLTDEDTPVDDEHEAPEEEDTPTEDDPEDHDPEYDVAGEKLKASQIQEWRKGYLRQGDYTRKTQDCGTNKWEELQSDFSPCLLWSNLHPTRGGNCLTADQLGGGCSQASLGQTVPPPSPSLPQHRPLNLGYGMCP